MNQRLVLKLGLAFVAAVSQSTAAQDPQGTTEALAPTAVVSLPKTAGGDVSVIVKFDAESLATYQGGLAGLDATSPKTTGERRLDLRSARSRAYSAFLAGKEQSFENAVRQRIPRARIVHRFRAIIGGVSVVLPADRVKELYQMPGVAFVFPDTQLPLETDRSPEFIGAPALWSKVGGQGNAGAGVVVGIIDSGMWPEHPSVADDGSYPEPPASWTGTACEFGSSVPGDVPFTCNNKLVGARRHMITFDTFGPVPLAGEFRSARDNNGHGSHTATTAVGNAGVLATTGSTVSGVAPRAHLAVYKVCYTVAVTGQGSCFTSDSAAAIQQGIADGVDVMNFSIGGGNNPYSDAVSLAFLDAYAAGVFVAAAGGNSGPTPETVSHRAPWMTTAAATTTDKGFAGSATIFGTGGATLPLTGISSTTDLAVPSQVVLSSAPPYNSPLCLVPAPAGTFTGKLVVCKRGSNARVSKSFNVAAGGAVGMILYNDPALSPPAPPASLNADVHAVPSLHINEAQGTALLAFLAANPGATGTITGGANDLSGVGDVIAGFSSRGGPNQTLGVSKPDVGAPGVNILAANTPMLAEPSLPQGQLFQIISGTSMASPHVAGAGALLTQLHPDWTPGQIQSALMMTATMENVVKEDGVTPATPYDVGSGRIDLASAGKPGLTISDTAENYLLLAGNLSTANYPSLYIPIMAGKAVVQRTLKSVDSKNRNWKIHVEQPDDLDVDVTPVVELKAGKEKTITMFIDASAVPLGQTRHATLLFSSRGGNRGHGHDDQDIELRFPVTIVRRQGSVTLNKTCDPLVLPKNASTTCTIQFTNTTFSNQTPLVLDLVPSELDVTGVTGAARIGNLVFFYGDLGPATPPQVAVEDGTAPFGYLALPTAAIAKTTLGDESMANFTVPAFVFAGQTYTQLGVGSNGYLVVGPTTASDIQFLNQNLPNALPPNNTLAAFWTDLNPGAIPASNPNGVRVALFTLTPGPPAQRWLIIDYRNVPNFTTGQPNSFQIRIGLNGVHDVTYAYPPVSATFPANSTGDGNMLTVGAENFLGNSGENYYYSDGSTSTGSLPAPGSIIRVTGTAALPGETKTITINAKARKHGEWRNCADMVTGAVFGVATSCVEGEVTKP